MCLYSFDCHIFKLLLGDYVHIFCDVETAIRDKCQKSHSVNTIHLANCFFLPRNTLGRYFVAFGSPF